MVSTLARNWVLLAVCGILEAIISVAYLVMWYTDGPVTFHSWNGTIVLLGKLAVGTGLVAIAAGLWRASSGKCWLLALHGLALGALGMILYGLTGFKISLLTISMLIVTMAVTFGILALILAQALGRRPADRWVCSLAGVSSGGFALTFLALGFHWIKIGPGSHVELFWLGAYFVFSAVCLLTLALRLRNRDFLTSGRMTVPAIGAPGLAH